MTLNLKRNMSKYVYLTGLCRDTTDERDITSPMKVILLKFLSGKLLRENWWLGCQTVTKMLMC